MQIKFSAFLLFLIIVFTGCSSPSSVSPQLTSDSVKTQTFFPVTEYLRGELSQLDSMPITPLKITTENGKQDSVWIKKENIREFAEPFLHPAIDTINFKHLFSERSFLDQTINAFTFSYDPINKLPDTLSLKRWDVYIDATKNTIKRIYLVKEIHSNQSTQTLQLTWKSRQWCKITTITEQAGKPANLKEELLKWDFTE